MIFRRTKKFSATEINAETPKTDTYYSGAKAGGFSMFEAYSKHQEEEKNGMESNKIQPASCFNKISEVGHQPIGKLPTNFASPPSVDSQVLQVRDKL